jgi:hypothetical protein
MAGLLDKAKELGKDLVPESKAIGDKARMVDEYVSATKPAPAAKSSPASKPINPNAKYGDRPGEQRIDVSDMTKPLPSYKHGTDYVPKTGPAILHKGEKVVPKEQNLKDIISAAHDHIGGGEPDKKPKKELHEIRTRKAKSGGYIHEHHHTHPEHYKMEEHTSPDQDSMAAHMMEHMGQPNPGEAEADAGQSGIEGEAQAAGAPEAA